MNRAFVNACPSDIDNVFESLCTAHLRVLRGHEFLSTTICQSLKAASISAFVYTSKVDDEIISSRIIERTRAND